MYENCGNNGSDHSNIRN